MRPSWCTRRRELRIPLGAVAGDAAGRWQVPPAPVFRDWLVVLERRS